MRFAGYAAIFDRVDRGGDIVRKGAFARAVAAGPDRVPLLWQHESGKPIGRIESIAEDGRGLRVIGRFRRDRRWGARRRRCCGTGPWEGFRSDIGCAVA